jgi:hypothetical protein
LTRCVPASGRAARRIFGLLAAVLPLLCLATTARSAPSASLRASFVPDRLGGRASIEFGFQLRAPAGQDLPALTEVEVLYPPNLGFALSGLGLSVCSPSTLEAAGTPGCPANSIMGHGDALAELRFGSQVVTENAAISIARAPDTEGHIALLLYVSGPSPVNTQILSPAQLLPASGPFGGRLNIELPLVPSLPGAPDIAIVTLSATLGPQGLTYFERVHGQTLAYQPKGILLPSRCPRGGFPFASEFGFVDGSRASATTTVPCPGRGRAGSGLPSSHSSRAPT